MDFRLRAATPHDIPAMHRLRMAVRENRLADTTAISEDDYLPFVRDGRAWVAEGSGTILGFSALDVAAASVWALFVDWRAEGQGVGRGLLDWLVADAEARGIARLALSTTGGTRAEHFYRANGWTVVAETGSGEIALERAVGPAPERTVPR